MTQWFAVPRRVVDVKDEMLVFAGGVKIDVCRRDNDLCQADPASVARREAFGRFARAYVLGKDISVVLTTRSFFATKVAAGVPTACRLSKPLRDPPTATWLTSVFAANASP
jgi:hypothetical protein